MRKWFFILFLLLGWTNSLHGQKPIVKNIKLNNDYDINHAVVDTFGFLWLAADQDIIFYDGQNDYVLHHFEDKITCLSEQGSNIWIGTESGIIYQFDAIQRTQVWAPRKISKFQIQNIIHKRGLTIITTYGSGIWIMDSSDTIVKNVSNGLLSDDIYDAVLHEDRLWLATDRGINILNFERNLIQSIDTVTGLPDLIITNLEVLNKYIWASTYQKGIFNIDPKTFDIHTFPFYEERKIIDLIDLGPDLIVATEDQIIQWNHSSSNFNILGQVQSINTMVIDFENNLWLFGDNSTVLKVNLYFFKYPLELDGVQAIHNIGADYWLGTESGLYLSDPDLRFFRSILADQNITSIHQSEEIIWIGTYTDGIFVLDKNGNILHKVNQFTGLGDNTILAIDDFDGDEVVVSTLSGVYRISLDANNLQAALLHESLSDHYILSIFRQKNGKIWLGTDRNGIICFDQGSIQTFSQIQRDSTAFDLGSVYSISEINEEIWFSTTEAGLVSLEGGNLQTYQFIPNDTYTSIIPIDQNYLLLINQNGVDLFQLSNKGISTLLELYGNEEQLFLNNYSNSSEQIDFTWNDQIFRFIPSNSSFKTEPTAHLYKVEVNLDPISLGTYVFKQRQNNFTFFYSGSWLSNPEILIYHYRLRGFDQTWRSTRDRMVSYPHLPPGEYTFELKVTDESIKDMTTVDSPTQYGFIIKRNFFNSVWFYLLLAIMVYGILYGIIAQRKSRSELKTELARNQLEAKFMNLKSQINPHFLFNSFNTLIGLIEEDQERSIKFTEKLTDYYRTILETGEKQWIPLSDELKLVRLYADILSERYGENLSISIKLKNEQYILPPLSIQMLFENAVKHNTISAKNKLEITIGENTDYLIIRNNLNPKLTGEPSTGIGLNNIKERLSHKTNIEMKVQKNEDEFMVYLPKVR